MVPAGSSERLAIELVAAGSFEAGALNSQVWDSRVAEGAVDTVMTNALILDHWGIVKADIGLSGGRIVAIGKAGSNIDEADAAQVAQVEAAGIRCAAVPLMMTDPDATAAMVQAAVDLATGTD